MNISQNGYFSAPCVQDNNIDYDSYFFVENTNFDNTLSMDDILDRLNEWVNNQENWATSDINGNQCREAAERIYNAILNNYTDLDLSDLALKKLPDQIGHLKNLITLNLDSTGLTELPRLIGNLTSLEKLSISDTQILELPEEIRKLSQLKELYLVNNSLFASLPSKMDFPNLKILDLSGSKIIYDYCIGDLSNTNLKQLILDNTELAQRIKDNGVDARTYLAGRLPMTVEHISTHGNDWNSYFFVENTNFDNTLSMEDIFDRLNEWANNQENWSILDSSGDQCREAAERIYNAILNNYTDLDLSELELKELPDQIWHLRNLITLNLDSTGLNELPRLIGNLTSLEKLSISDTQILELPEEIGQLSQLKELYLANNSFFTSLPSQMDFPNLKILDLSGSKIIYDYFIGDLSGTSLKQLILDNTQLAQRINDSGVDARTYLAGRLPMTVEHISTDVDDSISIEEYTSDSGSISSEEDVSEYEGMTSPSIEEELPS